MVGVEVPAHLDQAGWAAGVGEREQQDGSDRGRLLGSWKKRDHRPEPEGQVESSFAGVPSLQAIACFVQGGQDAPWMRSQPAHHVVT